MAKPNVLIRSKKNKAIELFNMNQLSEADAAFASICRSSPTDFESWVMRGLTHRKLGLFKESEAFCRRALAIKPDYAWGHQVLGTALQRQGALDAAIGCYRHAIYLQPDQAETYYLLANALSEIGQMSEAADNFRKAIQIKPDYLEALSNLGAALIALDKSSEANEVLNRALALSPKSPQVLCNLGALFSSAGQHEAALREYQRAMQINPEFADATLNVANLLEKLHRLDEAQAIVDRVSPQMPDNGLFKLVAAKLERRKGHFLEAATMLESALGSKLAPGLEGQIHTELGKLHDRLGDVDQAYSHMLGANRLNAQNYATAYEARYEFLDKIDRMGGYLTNDLAKLSPPEVAVDGRQDPVFLFGFPRSGTTLLGQILDTHADLQTLEERDTVGEMVRAFEEMTQGRDNALVGLSSAEIATLRQIYFSKVTQYLNLRPGAVLVDKMPINTMYAHIIWRIFPDAKFILAIRHPCDACLSCFMQAFAMNEVNACLLSLDDAAKVYARVMRLWQNIVHVLPLNYHRIRYEDLVTSFENETRALLDFIQVGWHDDVLKYAEHSKKSRINTPSYHQVTQPIYQHAKFRWQRYAKFFEPSLKTLHPYIDYFDYSDKSEAGSGDRSV
jgi:tetratricopeptide (TPR) repeat protein